MSPARPSDLSPSDDQGRILIVDGDALARWSLVEYLQRWRMVVATGDTAAALAIVAQGDVRTLILSDDLDPGDCDAIQAAAEDQRRDVVTVRTVTNVRGAKRPRRRCKLLEKPFALESLARLVGIGDSSIPSSQ
jgi:DNA-binding NtrC family response regulator